MIDSCPEGATELRVLQDGLVVAGSTSEKEAWRYYNQYSQDGPVEMQVKINGRWEHYATTAHRPTVDKETR